MTFKGLKTDLISEVKILWWQVENKANSVIFKAGNGKADTACSVVKIVKTNQKLANRAQQKVSHAGAVENFPYGKCDMAPSRQ